MASPIQFQGVSPVPSIEQRSLLALRTIPAPARRGRESIRSPDFHIVWVDSETTSQVPVPGFHFVTVVVTRVGVSAGAARTR